jgi:hypothetical protein
VTRSIHAVRRAGTLGWKRAAGRIRVGRIVADVARGGAHSPADAREML